MSDFENDEDLLDGGDYPERDIDGKEFEEILNPSIPPSSKKEDNLTLAQKMKERMKEHEKERMKEHEKELDDDFDMEVGEFEEILNPSIPPSSKKEGKITQEIKERMKEHEKKDLKEEMKELELKIIGDPDNQILLDKRSFILKRLQQLGDITVEQSSPPKQVTKKPVAKLEKELEEVRERLKSVKDSSLKRNLLEKKSALKKELKERRKFSHTIEPSVQNENIIPREDRSSFTIDDIISTKEEVVEIVEEEPAYEKDLQQSILDEIKKQMEIVPLSTKERKGFEHTVTVPRHEKEKDVGKKQMDKKPRVPRENTESLLKKEMEMVLKKMEDEKTFEIQSYINSPQYKEVEKILETFKSTKLESGSIEVEVSFGNFEKNIFHPGINSPHEFKCIEDYLISKSYKVHTTEDVVYYIEGYDTRKIVDSREQIYYERKIRESKIDFHDIGVRVSKSKEYIIDDIEFDKKWNEVNEKIKLKRKENLQNKFFQKDVIKLYENLTVERKRSRKTFVNGPFKYELTHVEEIKTTKDGLSKKNFKNEFEIELVKHISVDKLFGLVYEFIKVIQQFPLFPNCIDRESSEECKIISKNELKQAVSLHNKMFRRDMMENKVSYKNPLRLYEGYWNKPVNLKVNYLLHENINDYSITVKYDGVRKFLFITSSSLYMCGPPFDITKAGIAKEKTLAGTLLDCELIRNSNFIGLYIFDILFCKGEDVRNKTFGERYNLINEIAEDLEKNDLFVNVVIKKFYIGGSFYENVNKAIKNMVRLDKKGKIPTDGIILQSPGKYFSNMTWKWKEFDKLTIDFLFTPFSKEELEENKDNINKKYAYWISAGRREVFQGTKSHPYSGVVQLDSDELDQQKLSNKIVECRWDLDELSFVPIRIRIDRTQPNNTYTAKNIWEDIVNPFAINTLTGDDLVVMRKFHNQIKKDMLQKNFGHGSIILDIGSGRGGDLKKWDELSFRRVFAVEPNPENIQELEKRMKIQNIQNVTPLNIGVEQTANIKKSIHGKDKINGMVSFFSMTYFGKDKEMYDSFLNTINLIPPGGKFIGIVMDGERVKNEFNRVRKAKKIPEKEGSIIKNKAFEIKQLSVLKDNTRTKNKISITINDRTSMVKDQEEYLFNFKLFIEDMKKNDFTLLESNHLDNGPKYNLLSEFSKLFSGFNISFVFVKNGGVAKKDYINDFDLTENVRVGEVIPFLNPYEDDLYFSHGLTAGSSFVHCILKATSKSYNDSLDAQKIKNVMDFRKELGEKYLNRDFFLKMHNGEFSRRLYTPYMFEGMSKDNAIDKALYEFKEKIIQRNDNKPLGEISLLELAVQKLKMNIFVLVKQNNFEPSKLFYERCSDLYDIDRDSIVLIKDDIDYLLVQNKSSAVFQKGDAFISKIYSEIC